MLPSSAAPSSFDEGVQPHLSAMHASARAVVHSDDLAWDAVQVALVRLWNRGHDEAPSAAYLRRAAHLAALGIQRSHRRRCHHEACACRARGDETASAGPVDTLFDRDLPDEMATLLELLPEECREVLELRALHDLPYDVIARNRCTSFP